MLVEADDGCEEGAGVFGGDVSGAACTCVGGSGAVCLRTVYGGSYLRVAHGEARAGRGHSTRSTMRGDAVSASHLRFISAWVT